MIINNTSLDDKLIVCDTHNSILDKVKTPTSKFTEQNHLWGVDNTIEDEKEMTQSDVSKKFTAVHIRQVLGVRILSLLYTWYFSILLLW